MKNGTTTELPRERCAKVGPQALSLRELFALILGTGTSEHNVLELSGKLCKILGAESQQTADLWRVMCTEDLSALLQGTNGIGLAKYCRIVAALELAERIALNALASRNELRHKLEKIKSVDREMLDRIPRRLRFVQREWMGAVFVKRSGKISSFIQFAEGGLSGVEADLTDVLLPLLIHRPLTVGFFHNHPAGTLDPSSEDISTAKILNSVLKLCRVHDVKHWIVTKNSQIRFL